MGVSGTTGDCKLSLTQRADGGKQTLEISFEQPGRAREALSVELAWAPSPQDLERLRWYFEDYLQFPADPAPSIAADVERRMQELGKELFRGAFAGEDAQLLWARVRERLHEAQVEVVSPASTATLPWELMWDPRTDVPVAMRAASFTRGYTKPVQPPRVLGGEDRQVRILLAICRPGGEDDVPFRSVASRLVKGLGESSRRDVRLDVLRPPTYSRLSEVLRVAAETEPYHIVHFDGHGIFVDGRGRLVFEQEESDSESEPIDGATIGSLLVETGVPFLILNACRSAHSEPLGSPDPHPDDTHAAVRAYGSLALAAMDAGVTGVVAMQYNVYVSTAAHFVGDLYATLARGQSLGRAVSMGRKQLRDRPARGPGELGIMLQDWPVPVVYEASPVSIFPPASDAGSFASVELDDSGSSQVEAFIDQGLPAPPDAGFFGRDETLFALDRAFDHDRIVLLHAYAGGGKTASAAEFARWYTLTGGNEGPVLFTSFERYTPLALVLDDFGTAFAPLLAANRIQWLSLTDVQRRAVALQVLSRVPALWVWDNVEPVAGFPHASDSSWTEQEQQELLGFLRDLRQTRCRVLITSRRDERPWLGELPTRVTMGGMPFAESAQLARALARKRGAPIEHLDGWRELLRYTRGNPLTITAVVGEALRRGLTEPEDLEAFVADLREGTVELEDDEELGRAASLRASLGYGFREAFDDRERAILALLHLFEGTVTDFLLESLFAEEPSLLGVSEVGTGVVHRVLDTAAEIGQLIPTGGPLYFIHPALPAFFAELFAEHYKGEAAAAARSAYVEAMAGFAAQGARFLESNDAKSALLAVFEPSLLAARRQARAMRRYPAEIALMRGLHHIYEREGRWTAWARLLDETAQGILDLPGDGPLPGREDEWHSVTQWRVRLAFARGEYDEAARLQALLVDRVAAAAEESADAGRADDEARGLYESAAVALSELGQAQAEQRLPEGLETLERALHFAELSRASFVEAMVAHNLAAKTLELTNLEHADRCHELLHHALALFGDENPMARGRCYGELGFIAMRRGEIAEDATEARAQMREAIEHYERALELTPPEAKESLAYKYMNLGTVYAMVGARAEARASFDAAIKAAEEASQVRIAGYARIKIAALLMEGGDPDGASRFARRALDDLETVGPSADRVREAALQMIEAAARAHSG